MNRAESAAAARAALLAHAPGRQRDATAAKTATPLRHPGWF